VGLGLGIIGGWCFAAAEVWAMPQAQDGERLKQALAYRPTQKSIDYDQPDSAAADAVRLENASTIGQTGFVVRDAAGRMLRRFVDTSGNRKIDTWAYYLGGLEVYRDIDTDADGKPDRFQWLGPAGTKIGVDSNQDLVVDRWERISAQEATQVVVDVLNAGNPARLNELLITAAELNDLAFDPALKRRIEERLAQTRQQIDGDPSKREWPEGLKWLHFSAAIPGTLSLGSGKQSIADTDEVRSTEQLVEVFDHVSAIVELEQSSRQLLVGSMIRIGDAWRLIDFPGLAGEGENPLVGGIFFQGDTSVGAGLTASNLSVEGISPDLLTAYQAAEEALREGTGTRTGPALAILHQRRAQALWKVVSAARGAEREPWLRQFVDVVTSAYQLKEFPAGLELLDKQIAEMKKEDFDGELIAYAEFRHLGAWYSQATEDAENIDTVQDQWQKKLDDFVKRYPASQLAAEAMFQLANIDDYLGDVEAAAAVYKKIVTQYPDAPLASRAKGAVVRLTSVGKPIQFRGQALNEKPFSIDQLKGKMVLIHYWATWCEPCKAEFTELQKLHEKYAKDGFEIVSVSLDESRDVVADYLKQNRLPWVHLYEEGGIEASPLAAQLGVIALPTMILIDRDGNVVDRGVGLPQVERELRKAAR
jgi:thiol-disulfide isomerase/thioredoxin